MSQYLAFRKRGESASGKTEVWDVVAVRTEVLLGRIKWFGRWRQYTFCPSPDTIFNTDCLDEISNHVVHLNQQHKEQKEKS